MQNKHIKGLDGLRGLAAIAVFASHYDQIVFIDYAIGMFDLGQLFENGKFGVSLFFILSGFLLSLPFWDQLLNSMPYQSTYKYWGHRLVRIVPAYYVCLTVLLIINDEWRFALTYPDILLHYLFLFNLTEFSIFSFNSVFWTLAVEMQFYLLLPFLFTILKKIKSHSAIIVFSMMIVSYGIQYYITEQFTDSIQWPWDNNLIWVRVNGAVISHSFIAHLPHFITGVLGAWFFQKKDLYPLKKIHYEFLFWLAVLLLLIILCTPIYASITLPASRYGFPVVSILILIIIISSPQSLIAVKIIDSFLLKQLGIISYGIYIYHLPVLNYFYFLKQDRVMVGSWELYAITSFLLAIILALISFYFIEKPIQEKMRKSLMNIH